MDRIKRFLFKNTTTRQTVIKNTFWIGISTTLIKILRAAIIIYAARLIGTAEYGVFTYAMSIAAIFAVVSDMGLTSILTRELSKDSERTHEYFATALFAKLGFVAVMFLLIIGFGPLLSRFEQSTALLTIIAVSLVFESVRSFLYAVPRSQNNMQREAAISIVSELFCTALIVLVFLRSPSPQSLALSFMIGNGIGLLIAIISTRNYFSTAFARFNRKLLFPLISYTLPFAILGVFGIFMTNIDSLIVGRFGTEHLLGLFGAAQRPIGILYILPNFISGSIFPLISKFRHEGKDRTVASMINVAAVASIVVALPLVLGGMVVAQPLINVVFGYDYIGAVLTFQLLLITLLFVFPGTIFADILLIENRQRVFLLTSVIGAALNVGLDFLLIPRYGIAGSAVATIAAQAAVNTIFYLALRKRYHLRLFRHLYKSVVAAITMAIAAYGLFVLSVPLLIIIPVAALVYGGMLVAFQDRTVTEFRRSFRGA